MADYFFLPGKLGMLKVLVLYIVVNTAHTVPTRMQ